MAVAIVSRGFRMAFGERAPQSLPRAVIDLVAEGGNVLASDDAPLPPGHAELAIVPSRRMHLSQSGWIDRAGSQALKRRRADIG